MLHTPCKGVCRVRGPRPGYKPLVLTRSPISSERLTLLNSGWRSKSLESLDAHPSSSTSPVLTPTSAPTKLRNPVKRNSGRGHAWLATRQSRERGVPNMLSTAGHVQPRAFAQLCAAIGASIGQGRDIGGLPYTFPGGGNRTAPRMLSTKSLHCKTRTATYDL